MSKHWIVQAVSLLKASREPVAYEIKRKDTSSGNKFAEYVPYWA